MSSVVVLARHEEHIIFMTTPCLKTGLYQQVRRDGYHRCPQTLYQVLQSNRPYDLTSQAETSALFELTPGSITILI